MLDKAGECRGQGRENSTAFCSGWGINRPTGAPGLQSSIQMQLRPQSPQRKDSGHLDRGWIPGQIPVGEAMWLPFSQAGSTRATGLAAAGPSSPPPPNPVPQPGRGQGAGLRDPEHPPTPTGCLSPALPAALTGPRPRDKVGRDVRGCWLDGFSPHTPGLQVRLTSLRARGAGGPQDAQQAQAHTTTSGLGPQRPNDQTQKALSLIFFFFLKRN